MDSKFMTLPDIKDKNISISKNGTVRLVGKIDNRDLSKENVVVMCYADWCGHCHHLSPVFYTAYNPIRHSVIACKVSNEESKIVNLFGVTGYPTILKFEEGKFMGHFNGQRNAKDIMCFSVIKDKDKDKSKIKLDDNTTLTCN